MQRVIALFCALACILTVSFVVSPAEAFPHQFSTVPFSSNRTADSRSSKCGGTRSSIKYGLDSDARHIKLTHPKSTTIHALLSNRSPRKLSSKHRARHLETTFWSVHGTLTRFRRASDGGYEVIIQGKSGRSITAEILPTGCLGKRSPFLSGTRAARKAMQSRYHVTSSYQHVKVQVHVTGIGFFEPTRAKHHSTKSRVELVPVLGLSFTTTSVRPPVATSTPTPTPTPAPTSAPAATHCAAGSAVADPSAIHGLFASNVNIMAPQVQAAAAQYLPTDPTVCGVNLVIPWSEIDRGPGAQPQYDWSYLEQQAAPWEAAGKLVNLIVWGVAEQTNQEVNGQPATPQYVLNQAPTVNCPGYPLTPVYWNPAYQDPYRAFEAALVAHVANDPHIGYIRFGIGVGGEDYPENKWYTPPCSTQWAAAGLTPAQWTSYTISQIDYQASLHSAKPLLTGINGFPGAPTLPDQVAAEAARVGIGFGIQGLSFKDPINVAAARPCFADWCALFQKYAGQVPLEVQTVSTSSPVGSGNTGPLPPLLTFSINTMHAQVLELYPQEWLIADDPSWPGYQAFHTEYQQALQSAAAEVGGQATSSG